MRVEKTWWLVSSVSFRQKVVMAPHELETEVDLDWADGMVGAMPVFKTKEQAEAYANGIEVIEISIPTPTKGSKPEGGDQG